MPKTNFIAIDINCHSIDFSKFDRLTAKEKIALFVDRIDKICSELDSKTTTVFVSREYSFYEPNTLYVSSETNQILKEKISALTKKYPHIKIYSGTSSVEKPATLEKVEEILKYYDKLQWIIEHEKRFSKISRLEELKLQALKIKETFHDLKNPTYVTNKGMYFSDGTQVSLCKQAGFKETKHPHQMFKPGAKEGKKSNTNRFIKIPIENSEEIVIGFEICFEQCLGLLKKQGEEQGTKPTVHLVESDTTSLRTKNLHGKYVIHSDSVQKPKILLTENLSEEKNEIQLLVNDLLEDDTALVRVHAIYPLQLSMIKLIDIALDKVKDEKEEKENIDTLTQLKNNILKKPLEIEKTKEEYKYYLKVLKPCDSKAWGKELIKSLNEAYKKFTDSMKRQEHIDLCIYTMRKYIRLHKEIRFYDNEPLSKAKIKLVREFIKEINATSGSIKEINIIIKKYKNENKKCESEFNKKYYFGGIGEFEQALNKIEFIINLPKQYQTVSEENIMDKAGPIRFSSS